MNGISVFLTIALSLIVNLTGASFAARKVSSLEKNKSNYVEHKCGEPKPQFYYINEELETSYFSGSVLDPPAVLVSRCSRTTGCCPEGENCVMATEEDVFFTVHVVDDADELRQVPVPIKNHTSCKCVAQDDTFNSQPNDKTNSNDSKFPTIAIICGLICCFLSFLIAVAVLSLMKQLKEKRKGVLFNVAVTPQTSSIGIDMTQTCKNASL